MSDDLIDEEDRSALAALLRKHRSPTKVNRLVRNVWEGMKNDEKIKPRGRGPSYEADDRLAWLADVMRRRLRPDLSKQETLRRVTALHRQVAGSVAGANDDAAVGRLRNKRPKHGAGSRLAFAALLGEEDAAVLQLKHFDRKYPHPELLK